jgi:hypothetical protein
MRLIGLSREGPWYRNTQKLNFEYKTPKWQFLSAVKSDGSLIQNIFQRMDDMRTTLVIAATSDRLEVDRMYRLLRKRGISASIESRTVCVDGQSAEGYRLRVPSETVNRARIELSRSELIVSKGLTSDTGDSFVSEKTPETSSDLGL